LNRSSMICAEALLWAPFIAALLLMLTAVAFAGAQTASTSLEQEEQLERDFTDPLTTLPQVIIRNSYTPANYGTHVETNQAIIRPLIPRIPPNTILPLTS